MCNKCIILTYDEVLDVIHRIVINDRIRVEPDWPATYPVAFPDSVVPLVTPEFDTASTGDVASGTGFDGALTAKCFKWGFEQDWKQGLVFNTRIESADKAMWKDSIEHRRCIIPVRNFFETHREETTVSAKTGNSIKQRYQFKVPDEEVILIGGIWQRDRFSMVTTEANRDMEPIHHRMPLIMRQDEIPVWFGPDYRSLADRSAIPLMFRPCN